VPELFVWTVFRNLVNACYSLHTRPSGASPSLIIHIDIKPENVLMSNPESADPSPYPHPVLSDFESYFRLSSKMIWGDSATQGGVFAPEQLGPCPNTPVRVDLKIRSLR
jgi:serine/threonine protein kinase